MTTSGSLGLLFPTSLPLILYGVIAQQISTGQSFAIEDLFFAGLLPGLMMIFLLCCWSLWTNRQKSMHLKRFSTNEARAALREAAWEIPLPLFLIGGIYGGFLAISEAAAVTAVYVVVVEVFIYREIRLSQLPGFMRDSMVMVGGILLILGVSLAFTNFLVDAEIPMKMFALIQRYIGNKIVF